jgi:hypothetical protein
MPETENGKAVQVFDLLLEYFGEGGERWTRDRYDDDQGRRCLVGALHYLRCYHRVSSESAEGFLHEAIKQGRPYRKGGLVYFNDRCRNYAELRSAIIEARSLALGDAKTERAAAAVERWLIAEIEREQAARATPADELSKMFAPCSPDGAAIDRVRIDPRGGEQSGVLRQAQALPVMSAVMGNPSTTASLRSQ